MRSAGAALGWELWWRQRWMWLAIGGYLLVLTAVRLLFAGDGVARFGSELTFPFLVLVPMCALGFYALALFTHGLSGDLAARRSMYPQRFFTLPVTNAALAGWPMLYGTLTMAALWFAFRLLAVWPADFVMPVFWPALFAASLLAWTQALTWLGYPLRGLRVVVSVAVLISIDVVVFTAFEAQASETLMLALLAPSIPLAYVMARAAVARARRGDIPDWEPLFGWSSPGGRSTATTFTSRLSAQVWLEWRQYGRSLPLLVAIVLPFELGLLFLFSETGSVVFWTLVAILFTPAFLAVFVAGSVARSGSGASPGVSPFLAARPLSSAGMIAAKLRVTSRSMLVTSLILLAGLSIGLEYSGVWPMVAGVIQRTIEIFGKPRTAALGALAIALPMLSGWKHLVQSLCVGMTGRPLLIKGSGLLALTIATFVIPVGDWILGNKPLMARLWHSLPAILAILALCKLLAAAWLAVRLYDGGLLDSRPLIGGAIVWNLAVFGLFGLLRWILPPLVARSHVLLLLAIVMVPLVRLSAAPLALAWNRHR